MKGMIDIVIALPEVFLATMAMLLMMVGVYAKAQRAYSLVTNLAIICLYFCYFPCIGELLRHHRYQIFYQYEV